MKGQIPELVYLGYDLNDLGAINIAGYSVSPISAHKQICEIVSVAISRMMAVASSEILRIVDHFVVTTSSIVVF